RRLEGHARDLAASEHHVSVDDKLGASVVVARTARFGIASQHRETIVSDQCGAAAVVIASATGSGIISQDPAPVAGQLTIFGFLLSAAGCVTGWCRTGTAVEVHACWFASGLRCR